MSYNGNGRFTQHRPQKDKETHNKELAEAKREIHQLRREISRLNKQVQRAEQQLDREPSDDETTISLPPPVQSADICECGQPLKVISVGAKTLRACKACGWRKVA